MRFRSSQRSEVSPDLLCLALATVLGACSGGDDGDNAPADPLALEASDAGAPAPPAFTVASTAVGTACRGPVHTYVARDGLTFVNQYDFFEVEVTPRVPQVAKSCLVRLSVASAENLQLAVTDGFLRGRAHLEAGQRSELTGFFGLRSGPSQEFPRLDLEGAFDDIFVQQGRATVDDESWSPCGTKHDLELMTRVLVRNGATPGEGFFDVCNTDIGGPPNQSSLKVAFRRCEPDDAASAPSSGAITD